MRDLWLTYPAAAYGWVRRHPDLTCVALVLVVGAAARLGFAFRAPPLFVGGDSQTYLVPGDELAHGLGFAPILKRPPLYPLFVAFSIVLMGEDPHGLAFLQHLLGLGTVVLTYWLARAVFGGAGSLAAGRLAGLMAGLLIALNGTLIVYERYVMGETLATFLLCAAALALVVAAKRASWRLYALGGLLLALASLTRASVQLLLPIVPLVALLWHRPVRLAARLSGAMLAGFLVLALPWMALTLVQAGSFSAPRDLARPCSGAGARETPKPDQPRDRPAVGRRRPDSHPGPTGRLQPRLRG